MLRIALLLCWLLALPGLAAVLPDGSKLPPSDPDAPAAILPATEPGGSPQRVQVGMPAEKSQATGSPIGSGANSTAGSSAVSNSSKTAHGGNASGAAAQPSVAADVQPIRLPNGQPVPWSLLALAVLLFVFSVGGGVYFWQTRDN